MNIYIPIEIKVRELEGCILLALAAAEQNHTVIVGEKKDTIGLASSESTPKGLIHMKSITPHDSMLRTLNKLRQNGHVITVQDEESGLLDETYDTFAGLRFSERTIPLVDRVCAWGNYDARSLKRIYSQYSDKISITGSPRVDFWRKDFSKYYSYSDDAKTLNGKPYILIASNFGGPLNVNRFWNIMARLNEAGYLAREEGRERYQFENEAYQTRLIGEFVFMIRDLAKSYPDHHILVRPHPVESIEGWKKLIGNVPGIYVNRDGTISRWIRHAKVTIHNGCTSALEAAIAGENRIAYRPLPHEIERDIPNEVSTQVFSIDELKEKVQECLDGRLLHEEYPLPNEISEIIQDRFSGTDGRLSADRIADVWSEISEEKNMKTSSPDEFFTLNRKKNIPFTRRVKKSLVSVRNIVTGQKKEKKKKKLLDSSFKFPEFTDQEFEMVLGSLQKSTGRFNEIKYHRFGSKSFILYKDSNR